LIITTHVKKQCTRALSLGLGTHLFQFVSHVSALHKDTSTNELDGLSHNLQSGLGTHLFVKIHRPVDSEWTFSVFELSCHLLLPV